MGPHNQSEKRMAESGMPWDPNHPKYQCCCGSCHVTTGATIIGILSLISIALNFISGMAKASAIPGLALLVSYHQFITYMGPENETFSPLHAMLVTGGYAVFGGIITGCLLYGTAKERPAFLLPWLITQCLGLVLVGTGMIVSIILAAMGGWLFAGIMVAVVMLILLMVGIWFFAVVHDAYFFLKDKRKNGEGIGVQDKLKYAGYAQPPLADQDAKEMSVFIPKSPGTEQNVQPVESV